MPDNHTSLTFRLPDGRKLGYARYGSVNGDPFFYFHGMPGSRYEAQLLEASARALGLCICAIDRPGYGLSDYVADRSIINWPNDVAALADALDIETFGIIAVSGGGPYALACAHEIPGRISTTGIVCGLGPVHVATLRNEMHWLARSGFFLARKSPTLLRNLYGRPLKWLSCLRPDITFRLLARCHGEADRQVLSRKDIRDLLSGSLRESFRQGPFASTRDVVLYQRPWGFELENIHKQIHLWHGDADRIVPCQHSQFIHSKLPDSILTVVPDEGHFSLPIVHTRAILAALKKD
ncbi:pimeloyl-ACP methyl ester carboxylesterase [Thiogranum longum]|uniref:Pimeloyl-ACP methyl ester carboxylesterase n=1 Tax=Thiogranum longum TaxID=1537524 RepID=A0A4R1HDK2_9GAMM|nr:alpha/beta hydrolase [Thiogranum longum]TCK18230.1 pimeloyl-ACP methyl ester carboxylesterase [Thiogranum longum]